MRLDPADGGVHILDRFGKMHRGSQAVIDTEPGEAGSGERIEQGPDVGPFAAFVEPAAVDQDGGGKWPRPVGYVQVEEQGLVVRPGVFDVLLIEWRGGESGGAGQGWDDSRSHWIVLFSVAPQYTKDFPYSKPLSHSELCPALRCNSIPSPHRSRDLERPRPDDRLD